MSLTTSFMKRFTKSTVRLIVNISSLAAMEPFKTW
jgi:short-subunit dehydrogenase